MILPQHQLYHRENSIKLTDTRKQLICPPLFPLGKQLAEVAVAQTQMSPWDLNTETLIWKTNHLPKTLSG